MISSKKWDRKSTMFGRAIIRKAEKMDISNDAMIAVLAEILRSARSVRDLAEKRGRK
jgi:hypothetical protein